jgi:hypothetical protein
MALPRLWHGPTRIRGDEMTEQLTGRELDAALARALGCEVVWIDTWDDEGTPYRQPLVVDVGRVPFYSTDLNAMHEVEAEIERRWLVEQYMTAIEDVYDDRELSDESEYAIVHNYPFWSLTHATAEQRARAALAVLTAGVK